MGFEAGRLCLDPWTLSACLRLQVETSAALAGCAAMAVARRQYADHVEMTQLYRCESAQRGPH